MIVLSFLPTVTFGIIYLPPVILLSRIEANRLWTRSRSYDVVRQHHAEFHPSKACLTESVNFP
jgi:hypothetical protein